MTIQTHEEWSAEGTTMSQCLTHNRLMDLPTYSTLYIHSIYTLMAYSHKYEFGVCREAFWRSHGCHGESHTGMIFTKLANTEVMYRPNGIM